MSITTTPTRFADRAVAKISKRFGRGGTRRSFLMKTAVVGSALAVNPLRFLLRPGTAYAALCGPAAGCDSGWTAMCCTVNGGANTCPPGSIPAGWWKADNSSFCNGSARYYIDCNATCGSCGCSGGICAPGCYSCQCHCASGTCDQRHTCCTQFRYGQCHQEVACLGAIVCRVVTCVPPWQFDPSCTTASATANETALHDAPCLHFDSNAVFAFGKATGHGAPEGPLRSPIVGMDVTPTGKGYWLVASDGGVFSFGDAQFHGSTGGIRLNRPIVGIASTPSGRGYWIVASDGGIFCFGDAQFHGSTGAIRLNRPIVGMAPTRSGKGYFLVASDGGIFAFGNAQFQGSTGGIKLNQPIVDMAAPRDGKGYWLVAADGGVFCFGSAPFYGSLNSLGGRVHGRAVDIAGRPAGDGYWIATNN